MSRECYIGISKCHLHPDYTTDIYDCTDEEMGEIIEANRDEFRKEWLEYNWYFYD